MSDTTLADTGISAESVINVEQGSYKLQDSSEMLNSPQYNVAQLYQKLYEADGRDFAQATYELLFRYPDNKFDKGVLKDIPENDIMILETYQHHYTVYGRFVTKGFTADITEYPECWLSYESGRYIQLESGIQARGIKRSTKYMHRELEDGNHGIKFEVFQVKF